MGLIREVVKKSQIFCEHIRKCGWELPPVYIGVKSIDVFSPNLHILNRASTFSKENCQILLRVSLR